MSSKISTKPPSGTRDFLPPDIARRRHVVDVVERVYSQYGFVPLETPAFENLSTLLGKYGEEGDQLLYRLLHRRDALARALEKDGVSEADLADQGLRYDLTVPLARVVAQYRDLPRYFKRYQIQPVWRADRPGRGRFREFYQCDIDSIGSQSLLTEAEVCGATARVLDNLGFKHFTIQLNHRQLLRALIHSAGIDETLESTALIAVDKLDKIGREGVLAELDQRGIAAKAAQSLLDGMLATDAADTGSPTSMDRFLTNTDRVESLQDRVTTQEGEDALLQLGELLQLLDKTPAAGHVRLNPALARGLSYYTGPIFEITLPDLSGSLGGGGRYDDLIGMFGKQSIPAVGFSLGLERILLVMDERQMYRDAELRTGPEVLLCWMGVGLDQVLRIAHELRKRPRERSGMQRPPQKPGLRVEVYPEATKRLGKQLQYASTPGVDAPVAAIVGTQELSDGTVTLRHLASGEQRCVALDEACAVVHRWMASESQQDSRATDSSQA